MSRQQFGAAKAALGLAQKTTAARPPELETFQLSRNGWVPNNQRLPVLLYRRVFGGAHVADQMESTVPQKQKLRGRLWLNDGSCVRLRPERRNHVWSYDFVSARTHDGRSVRILNLIDEHTRESLLVRAERRWSSSGVISARLYESPFTGVDPFTIEGLFREEAAVALLTAPGAIRNNALGAWL